MVKRHIISLRSIFKYKEKFILPLVGKQNWLDAVSTLDVLTSGLKCFGRAGRDTWTEVGSRYLDLKVICNFRASILLKECQS